MDRICSMQDLEKAKTAALHLEVNNMRRIDRFQIRVGLGSCGIAAGAKETWEAIQQWISNKQTGGNTDQG